MPFEPRYKTLIDVYRSSTKQFADRPLFGTKRAGRWEWMTYREFAEQVEAVRGGLASLGVGRGDAVAIIADNRVEWAVSAYATYGLGARFVPMYEAQHAKEWEFIVRDCGAKVLIAANDGIVEKMKGLLAAAGGPLTHVVSMQGGNGSASDPVLSYKTLRTTGKTAALVDPNPDDVAGLIYTSGTTGTPKGVILSHLNFASDVSAVHEAFELDATDRSLSFLPWAHSFGQTAELHMLFSFGASLALAESVDKIIDNIAEVQPTILIAVPRVFNKIYQAVQKQIASKPAPLQALVKRAGEVARKKREGGAVGLLDKAAFSVVDKVVYSKVRARFGGRLRFVVSGGAAISREVAEFIDGIGLQIFEGYGLSETSPVVSVNLPHAKRMGSVGKPLPGVQVQIDPTNGPGSPKGPGMVEGEIVVRGPIVMKGYFNRPEETAQVLTPDGGLRTGDMGYLDAEGYLFITGRIKEQYKLENGKYVVPTPLEEMLKVSPYVLNSLIYGDNRPYNVAVVAANVPAVKEWAQAQGISASDDAGLLAHPRVRELFEKEIAACSKEYRHYELIKDFVLVPTDFTTQNGMLTASLKVKRRKVIETYGTLVEELYAKKAGAARSAAPAA